MAWPQQPEDGSHHQFYRFLSTARTFRIDTGMNRIRTLVGVLLVLIGNFFSVLSLLTSSASKNRCALSVPKSTTTRCTAHTARPSMSVWNASSGLLDDLSNPFVQSMEELGYNDGQKEKIASELDRAELTSLSWSVWDAMFSDFLNRPEIISEQLQTDFGFSPLLAHQTRAALVHALRRELPARSSPPLLETNTNNGGQAKSSKFSPHATESDKGPSSSMPLSSTDGPTNEYHNSVVISNSSAPPKPLFKQTVVNEHAKRRKQEPASRDYGLPADVKHLYPALYNELQAFYDFMTVPSTISQETPIKQATANVYLRHARLFLGWYVKTILADSNTRDLSLETIIPNKEKKSASIILQFLMFLRTDRKISVSYEARYVV